MEMTTEEIKALQRELGVTPDGIIGPNTRAAAEAKIQGSRSIAEAQAQAEKFGDITNTEGLVRGSDTSVSEPEVVVPKEGDTKTENGINYVWNNGNWEVVTDGEEETFKPFMLYNSSGAAVLVNSKEEENIFRSNGFTLTEPPAGEGSKIDTSTLENLLGTYATQAQVQEIAQTGPSTFEQAKGLYPYLDDRLIRLFLNKYAESGNERLALAEMRADPIMNDIYPGIKRDDGSLRMTEQEYVAAVDNMKATVRTYNLNPNEFQDDIVSAISGDVSPLEFRQRMEAGYEGVVNNIPQVKQAYLDNFGIDLPDESIFAMFVSPNVATKILEGNIRASQVIGEAEAAGFGNITAQVGQSLVTQGLTQEGARQGFGQAALTLEGLQGAAARQGRRGPTASGYVEATQLGQAEELKNLQNITAQIQSESAAVLGAVRTQTGAVTGLEEA
jgi:peptidoglycan hydrolase-like protein with peptidoglycan-binding domain|tara:strand:- start:399 stop:1730 length:1332 start_codon:yes stop_codon:yes gene_type:complete